jgi:hypothetical protein
MIELQLNKALERVQNLEELAQHLELLLNSGCYVWVEPNGERILLFGRALVEKINGLKIHIYADEHAPPHFHVLSSDIDAAFTIRDCTLIRGSVDGKTRDLIVYWHGSARRKLVEFWNRTRPTDCPVGPIHEEA